MKYNPGIHCRRLIRLQDYDYSNQGAYFVTICTWNRVNILCDVLDSVMQLTSFGEIVMKYWEELPNLYNNIELDKVVIMPNHLHGIIWINGDIAGAGLKPAPTVLTFHHYIDKQVLSTIKKGLPKQAPFSLTQHVTSIYYFFL
jgi:REP element-mobilizing transposase RayT